LNPDGQQLHGQESVLRENGFEIISAATPLQARFEIEMGTCEIFLTNYVTPFAIYRDLANLSLQARNEHTSSVVKMYAICRIGPFVATS
jgi:hypothetical protein